MRKSKTLLILLVMTILAVSANAHDTWVQINTNLVRVGDAIHVDLMLGNHGNEHRDFKLAGKASLENMAMSVVSPDGQSRDLKPTLFDNGYAPREGFWSTRFVTDQPGLYTFVQTGCGCHLCAAAFDQERQGVRCRDQKP